MKIAWIQDLHLKSHLNFRKKILVGDMGHALDQIAEICVQRRVSAIILGGDVFDSPRPEAYALRAFGAFVRKLEEGNIEVYDLQGNHDKTTEVPGMGPAPSLAGCSDVTSINGVLTDIRGVAVYGLNYAPSASIREQLQNVPECDILCMHARFQHMIGFDETFHFTLEDIPEYVKWCVLCGDIHVTDVTEYRKDRWFVSSGSIYPVRYGEHLRDHTVCILDTETKVPELVKIKCRRYVDVDNIPKDQLGSFLDMANENVVLPTVFITADTETLQAARPDYIFAKQAAVKHVGETEEETQDSEVVSLEHAIQQYCKDDLQTSRFLDDLTKSGNPAQYMEDWVKLNI